jgi:hypothetical protein
MQGRTAGIRTWACAVHACSVALACALVRKLCRSFEAWLRICASEPSVEASKPRAAVRL